MNESVIWVHVLVQEGQYFAALNIFRTILCLWYAIFSKNKYLYFEKILSTSYICIPNYHEPTISSEYHKTKIANTVQE